MIKTFSKLERDGYFLSLIKGMYKKLKINSVVNPEILNFFLLRSETNQGSLYLYI